MAQFYLDNDVPFALTASLTSLGHVATHTQQLHNERVNDAEQFVASVRLSAVFVTNNGRDFILLNRAWNLWDAVWGGLPLHQGILVLRHGTFPQADWARQIDRIVSGHLTLQNQCYGWHVGTGTWRRIP